MYGVQEYPMIMQEGVKARLTAGGSNEMDERRVPDLEGMDGRGAYRFPMSCCPS